MELDDDVYKKIVDEFYSRVSDETEFVLKVEPNSMSFIPCKPFRAYREENNMKYRVIINLYYNNPEYFYFDNAEEAVQFLRMAAEHIGPQDEDKKTEIMLEVVDSSEVDE